MPKDSRFRRLAALGALLTLASTPALAKDAGDYVDDLRDYVLSPLHWDEHDWILAGEAAAATAAAYSLDYRARNAFAPSAPAVKGDPHSARDNLPAAALVVGTLATGLFTDNPELRATSRDMTEAFVLASGSAFALKHVFGRTRPDATMDRSAFRSGGDSFPSGHTAAAFAVAQTFADSRPEGEWTWRAAAYSLGALTAYIRVNDNMHWFSDTVAGAALGMATGRFVSNRNSQNGEHHPVRLGVRTIKGGALLSLKVNPYDLMER